MNLKPLSYAFNRAKKLKRMECKQELIKHICSGELRVWAEKVNTWESDECYQFGKLRLPLLQKSKCQSNRDKYAYKLAYEIELESDESHFLRYHNVETISLWLNFQKQLEKEKCLVTVHPSIEYDDPAKFCAPDVDICFKTNTLEVKQVLMLPNRFISVSRYRTSDQLIFVRAEKLYCHKQDVDKIFPYAREYRSDKNPGRPSKYDKDELFSCLQDLIDKGRLIIIDDLKVSKKAVRSSINSYFDGKYEDGGPSSKTRDRYAMEFLKQFGQK